MNYNVCISVRHCKCGALWRHSEDIPLRKKSPRRKWEHVFFFNLRLSVLTMPTVLEGGKVSFVLSLTDLLYSFTKENINIFHLCHHIKFVFLSVKENSRCTFFCLLFSMSAKSHFRKRNCWGFAPLWKQQVHFQGNKQKRKSCFIWSNSNKDKVQPFPLFVLRLVEPQMSQHPVVEVQRGFLRSSTCICGPRPDTCVSNKAEVLLYPVTKP